jgi:hypothetical protein
LLNHITEIADVGACGFCVSTHWLLVIGLLVIGLLVIGYWVTGYWVIGYWVIGYWVIGYSLIIKFSNSPIFKFPKFSNFQIIKHLPSSTQTTPQSSPALPN